MTHRQQKDIVTWATINNLIPIISSSVLIALSWANLSTRVAIVEEKVDVIIKYEEKISQHQVLQDNKVEANGNRITALETILKDTQKGKQ